MKLTFKTFLAIFATVISIISTSCSSSNNSDPETEKAIAGTWSTSFSDSEDGVVMKGTETSTYSLEDHKFNTTIKYYITYPITASFCTITYSGTWEASKEELTAYIDKSSVEFSFNKRMTDKSDREGFKSDILHEMEELDYYEILPFISDITDTFESIDEDGETITYHRIK